MKKIIGAVVGAGIVLALVGAVILGVWRQSLQVADPSGKPVIKIGAILPLTGNSAAMGKSGLNAAILAIEHMNQNPNNKYEYVLIPEDFGSDPSKLCIPIYNKLTLLNHVKALISMNSIVGMALKPYVNKDKVVHVSAAAEDRLADGYFSYKNSSDSADYAQKLVELMHEKGWKTISLAYFNHQAAVTNVIALKAALEKNKIPILSETTFNPTDRQFGISAYKITRDNPDVVYVFAEEPNLTLFARDLRRAGYKGRLTTFYLFPYAMDKGLFEGEYYVDFGSGDKTFAQAYEERFKTPIVSTAPVFYDSMMVLYHLFEDNADVTTDTAAKVRAVSEKYVGPNGRLYYRDGGILYTPGVIKQIVNGQPVPAGN